MQPVLRAGDKSVTLMASGPAATELPIQWVRHIGPEYQTLLQSSQSWRTGTQRRFLAQTWVEASEQGWGRLVS